jgi:hypothetical protein
MATYKSTSVDQLEAIGIRVLRDAEDIATASRHHSRSDRIIEDVEQAAQDLRSAVRATTSVLASRVTCSRAMAPFG